MPRVLVFIRGKIWVRWAMPARFPLTIISWQKPLEHWQITSSRKKYENIYQEAKFTVGRVAAAVLDVKLKYIDAENEREEALRSVMSEICSEKMLLPTLRKRQRTRVAFVCIKN